MLFRMTRTQTTNRGTLRAGVAYDARQDAKLKSLAADLIAKGFAEEVTLDQLKKEKASAEKIAKPRAAASGAKD